MKKIGGNLIVELKQKIATVTDTGEQIEEWETVDTLVGFLDSTGGDSKYSTYNAKIEESTNVFVCDYKLLPYGTKSENTRIFVPKTNRWYDVLLIDNPMELDYHLEFYIKYTGGQN